MMKKRLLVSLLLLFLSVSQAQAQNFSLTIVPFKEISQLDICYMGKKFLAGLNVQWGSVVNYHLWAVGPTVGYFMTDRQKKNLSLYLIGRVSYVDFKGKLEGNGAWLSVCVGGEYRVLFVEIGPEFLLLRHRETGISVIGIEPFVLRLGVRLYL